MLNAALLTYRVTCAYTYAVLHPLVLTKLCQKCKINNQRKVPQQASMFNETIVKIPCWNILSLGNRETFTGLPQHDNTRY